MSRDSETFLNHRELLWVWISGLTIAICLVLYVFHSPIGGKNGGTFYGLSMGTLCAAAMVFLMLYARRKRAYHSTFGTLKAWLSAHIWIGLALIVLVPLHSGFQFGWNVHTLCYAFIVVTIITGIWGAFLCVALPPALQARREGLSAKVLLSEINVLSSDVGILAKNKSPAFLKLINEIDFSPMKSVWQVILSKQVAIKQLDERLLSKMVHGFEAVEQGDALKLIGIVEKKIELTNKLYQELRTLSLLKIWLYVHLPFAVGGFTLLVVHVFSVFYLR
jgi:hypothetical protein